MWSIDMCRDIDENLRTRLGLQSEGFSNKYGRYVELLFLVNHDTKLILCDSEYHVRCTLSWNGYAVLGCHNRELHEKPISPNMILDFPEEFIGKMLDYSQMHRHV
jgi:hypothetical protein